MKIMLSTLCALALVVAMVSVAHGAVRVSCVGDSITVGVCSQQSHGYPALLQGLLGSGFTVTNYGNSGKTMLTDGLCGPPASGNCSYVGTPTWPAALASNPDIVTIMLGTNDAKEFNWFGVQDNTADSYVLDLMRMIKTLKALPTKPKIFVMTLVPLYTPFPYDMNATVINKIISTVPGGLVAQIADIADVGLIDVHAAFAGQNSSITCDGCHPQDAGYEIIARTMAPYIRQAALDVQGAAGTAVLEEAEAGSDGAPMEKVRAMFGSAMYNAMAQKVNRHL